ncbi:MAG: ATP phosphoribosyltransferase regulatory subunit [Candidatus Aquiluna sp.]|nr:ATP phosphoribosyltransferase regulatory subunit [Aquiluna sp.]
MRDLLPAEKQKREQLISLIRETYAARGFQEIETPAVEAIERLSSGQGGDNEKLVFKVLKRGEELERAVSEGKELADLGLRFDLTVPLTRYFASNRASLPRVLKAIQVGPVWRAERPQKGRYRQFLQCDIDILGEPSELAELELISASLAALDAIGLSKATIRVNDRRLLKTQLDAAGISADQDRAMIAIDKLDKIGLAKVVEEIAESWGTESAQKVSAWLSADVSDWPEELAWVQKLGDDAARLRYDPSLVRGMGYYTGAIFEIEYPGAESSIGGGGRYDEMVGRWAGTDTPAAGISLGIERIIELSEIDSNKGKSLVVLIEDDFAGAMSLQEELIAEGYSVRLERKAKNIKAQLEELAANGYEFFAYQAASRQELEIRSLA